MNTSGSKMWMWAGAVVLAAALLAGWMWRATPASAPVSDTNLSANDTTSEIDKELQATDLGNPADELKTTDADLNSL